MSRPRYRYRSTYRRRSNRPSERILRGAVSGSIAPSTTETVYSYEVETPQTIMNISLDLSPGDASVPHTPYALVVVPEGYTANSINWPAISDDMYNPTKNVLIAGVLGPETSDMPRYVRIGRKMAHGDRIALLVYNAGVAPTAVMYTLSFTALF